MTTTADSKENASSFHAPGAARGEGQAPYLPAAIGEEDQDDGDGGAGHGVGGGHAVLGVVEDLQLDHGRRGGPRPADDVLGALAQVHDQHPGDHQPPAHQGVQVPDPEGEEEDVEELVAQLRAEAEQVVERPVAHVGQLALLARQRVSPQGARSPRRGRAQLGGEPVPHAVGGAAAAAAARLGPALIAVGPGGLGIAARPRLSLSAPGVSGELRLRLLALPRQSGGRGGAARRRFHPAQPLETGHFLRVLQTRGQPTQALAQRHGNGTRAVREPEDDGRRAGRPAAQPRVVPARRAVGSGGSGSASLRPPGSAG